MSQPSSAPTTISLETVKHEFKQWWASRKHRSRIPDELWEAAASLSGQYTVHYISRSLGVNHSALRDRVAAVVWERTEKLKPVFLNCLPHNRLRRSDALLRWKTVTATNYGCNLQVSPASTSWLLVRISGGTDRDPAHTADADFCRCRSC